MLVLLSPSKTLDFDTPARTSAHTQPELLSDSEQLANILRDYDVAKLGKLMDISEKLAELNVARYQSFETPFTMDNARQALLAFKGDVYTDFDLEAYSEQDFRFAQDHIRILSGLYGVLRPLDLMQPYRLEMGTRLKTERGKNLYAFWGTKISERLNEALDAQGDDVVLNLASNEYFKAVDRDALKGRIVDVDFLDWKKDQYKIISFYAKRTRGTMSNWIVRNRITDPDGLKDFAEAGYYFSPDRSSDDKLVFLRDEKP